MVCIHVWCAEVGFQTLVHNREDLVHNSCQLIDDYVDLLKEKAALFQAAMLDS